jgi:hypothetical protein
VDRRRTAVGHASHRRHTLTELWRGDGSRTLADLPDVLAQDTLSQFGQSVPPGLVRDVLLAEERKFSGLL